MTFITCNIPLARITTLLALIVLLSSSHTHAVSFQNDDLCMLCEEGIDKILWPITVIESDGTTCSSKALELAVYQKPNTGECDSEIAKWRDVCCGETPPVAVEIDIIDEEIRYVGPNAPCGVCWSGDKPTLHSVMSVLYVGSGTCDQFEKAGQEGRIPDHLCNPIQFFAYEVCGCGEYAYEGPKIVINLPSGSVSKVPASLPDPTLPPTSKPTAALTTMPTLPPTPIPSVPSTPQPTASLTPIPTVPPTSIPTVPPTPIPTAPPTPMPTLTPTQNPTPKITPNPTAAPTPNPILLVTPNPTPGPTIGLTTGPTTVPTPSPTLGPTPMPTLPLTPIPTLPLTQNPTPVFSTARPTPGPITGAPTTVVSTLSPTTHQPTSSTIPTEASQSPTEDWVIQEHKRPDYYWGIDKQGLSVAGSDMGGSGSERGGGGGVRRRYLRTG